MKEGRRFKFKLITMTHKSKIEIPSQLPDSVARVCVGQQVSENVKNFQTGTELELNVVEVFTPTQFYFQLKRDWDKLDSLDLEMNNFYSSYHNLDEIRVHPYHLRVGEMVAVVWDVDGLWYRGVVRNMESVNKVEIDYIDYGSRTVTLKTRIYQLVPQFCSMARLSHVGRLHGVTYVNNNKKWTLEASTRFSKMVMDLKKDERNVVLHGKVMGSTDGRLELDLVYTQSGVVIDGIKIADSLVNEGHALFVGQQGVQVPVGDIGVSGTIPSLPVVSLLGKCVVGAVKVKGSLPDQVMKEVLTVKEEARAITEELDDSRTDIKRQSSLVNKAVGVLVKILMEVKPVTHVKTKEESEESSFDDDLFDVDSGVDSRSVQSLYLSNQARLSSQEESGRSSRSDSVHQMNEFLS